MPIHRGHIRGDSSPPAKQQSGIIRKIIAAQIERQRSPKPAAAAAAVPKGSGKLATIGITVAAVIALVALSRPSGQPPAEVPGDNGDRGIARILGADGTLKERQCARAQRHELYNQQTCGLIQPGRGNGTTK